MPWMKIDDSFESHPKVKSIPKGKRTKAIGLWTLAGSWCARHLTDGFVPSYMVGELGGTTAESSLLVSASLWHEVDGGFEFHDWTDHQPSRAKVEEERDAAKERMRAARERKKGTGSQHVRANTSERVEDGSENFANGRSVTPTRPDPTRPDPSKRVAAKRATALPEDWRPSDAHRALALERGVDPVEEYAKFRDWSTANGSTKKDWDATFRNWLRNARPTSNVHQLRTDDQGHTILPPLPSRSPWGQ